MKKRKGSAGFTLIELIVVIAILGILAAVAIPAYNGYIAKAKEAADIAQLDAIKTAAIATYAEDGAVSKIVVTSTSVTATVGDSAKAALTLNNTATATGAQADFDKYMSGTTINLTSDTYKDGATWYATAVTDGAENAKHPAGWVAGAVTTP